MERAVRVAGFVRESIVDGPGFRFALFCQGCLHGCPGCHNTQTHPLDGGGLMYPGRLLRMMEDDPLLSGLTLTGGEPMLQAGALLPLARGAVLMGLDVWVYSGYTFEELTAENDPDRMALLGVCSVLVDGRFEAELRSWDTPFRGSSNQRLIDLPASLREKRPVLAELERFTGEK